MLDNYSHTRTQRAVDTPFDNTENGFVSSNVQDAITEASLGIINFTQAQAYVSGSSVIYVSFDQLVSQDLVPLTFGVSP